MSEKDKIQGLSCPKCGGMVPIPEGQIVVRCPFCDLRSFVQGERGLRRYQVPQKIDRPSAMSALKGFLTSSLAIARNAPRTADLNEAFLVYLPFWTVWGRIAAWAFGQKKVGSGNNARYEPREVRLVQEMTWNGAACDVGEFGVNELLLTDQELQPYNIDALHQAGMVFEPVSSFDQARQTAEYQFQEQVKNRAGLDRLSQLFSRSFRQRHGLVYYPLWVLRYLYRDRAFQVVVDGYTGKVLYGKAPGNTLYRAVTLVLGMALGAFLTIDITALIVYFLADSDDFPVFLVAASVLGGLALMYTGYRRFRYGEQYEYRTKARNSKSNLLPIPGLENPFEMFSGITGSKDVEEWFKRLS